MLRIWLALLIGTVLFSTGCALRMPDFSSHEDLSLYEDAASLEIDEIEYEEALSINPIPSSAPRSISNAPPSDYWNLSLDEVIKQTLLNSKVFRDLGGTVLRAPERSRTILEPAIRENNPRSGVEAALSEYDARFSANGLFEKNDRQLNNIFTSGGTRSFQQDLNQLEAQLSKTTAIGTEFSLAKRYRYDANNGQGNLLGSAWDVELDMEMRQPLLQGAGVSINRIAGPNSIPGVYNGVLVARINTEVSLTEFELGVRDLVANAENAYWDLYFAYRDLDAKRRARDASLDTWRYVQAKKATGRPGGEDDRVGQAGEQYYRFEEALQNALAGRIQGVTATNVGSSGGSFLGQGGVYVSERRLRLMMGLPISDGQLARPTTSPSRVKIQFSWDHVRGESLARRVELRRQLKIIRLREMELTASENHLMPQLDFVARQRWRGFGKDLLRIDRDPNNPIDSAYRNLTDGNHQEWQMGFELSVPLGFRRAHSAVHYAQLRLAREKAILFEQQRQVEHDLSNAIADLDRAFTIAQTNFNRRSSAQTQLTSLQHKMRQGLPFNIDQLFDAQRRFANADVSYHRATVEYALALRNVHFEKGSLLDHHEIELSEGDWPSEMPNELAGEMFHAERELIDYSRSPAQNIASPQNTESPRSNDIPASLETTQGPAIRPVRLVPTISRSLPPQPVISR